MKILKKDLKNNTIKLKIDNLDDLWVLDRIVSPEDIVESTTTRIVKKESGKEGKRKKMRIRLKVEKIEFKKFGNDLKILGPIEECSNPDVSRGSYHSITLSPGDKITIIKKFRNWELERIKNAEESSKRPQVLLCAADYGEATFAVLREFGIEFITDFSESLPGKKKEALKLYEKSREDFLVELAKILKQISENKNISKVVLGGTGFLTENFKETLSKFPSLKKKLHFVKISSSGKTGINEIIKRGAIEKIVKGSRISKETKVIDPFFSEVSQEGVASDGEALVKQAIESGGAERVLISESFIQEKKEKERFEELDKLIKEAENTGAEIMIISDEHEAGEKFAKMKIGALLRYKIE